MARITGPDLKETKCLSVPQFPYVKRKNPISNTDTFLCLSGLITVEWHLVQMVNCLREDTVQDSHLHPQLDSACAVSSVDVLWLFVIVALESLAFYLAVKSECDLHSLPSWKEALSPIAARDIMAPCFCQHPNPRTGGLTNAV